MRKYVIADYMSWGLSDKKNPPVLETKETGVWEDPLE